MIWLITIFQYSVKFVCGESRPEPPPVLALGYYYTAINVHNPTKEDISFRKKIAVALPKEKAGFVTDWFKADLKKDEALEIDCADIRDHLPQAEPSEQQPTEPLPEFLKGFVVIESSVELDVVAVYTAAGMDRQVATIHTERVAPRQRQLLVRLPDILWPQLGE